MDTRCIFKGRAREKNRVFRYGLRYYFYLLRDKGSVCPLFSSACQCHTRRNPPPKRNTELTPSVEDNKQSSDGSVIHYMKLTFFQTMEGHCAVFFKHVFSSEVMSSLSQCLSTERAGRWEHKKDKKREDKLFFIFSK